MPQPGIAPAAHDGCASPQPAFATETTIGAGRAGAASTIAEHAVGSTSVEAFLCDGSAVGWRHATSLLPQGTADTRRVLLSLGEFCLQAGNERVFFGHGLSELSDRFRSFGFFHPRSHLPSSNMGSAQPPGPKVSKWIRSAGTPAASSPLRTSARNGAGPQSR